MAVRLSAVVYPDASRGWRKFTCASSRREYWEKAQNRELSNVGGCVYRGTFGVATFRGSIP